MEFSRSPPRLRLSTSGNINRIHFYSQCIILPYLYKIGHINIILYKHTIDGTKQIPIHPYFCPIIDTVQLQPNILPLKRLRDNKLCTEPISIKVTSDLREIRD